MRSWRKTLTGLLVFLLAVLLGFLVWTNISYYAQAVDNVRRQNAHTAELWGNSVETRMEMLYQHLHELLLTVYNTDLNTGTQLMRYSAKKKCVDTMQDKLRASEGVACFYLEDTESDQQFYTAANELESGVKMALRDYFSSASDGLSTALADRSWRVEEIGGELFFVKMVALGKNTVGVASSLASYDIMENYSVAGTNAAGYLAVSGRLYPMGQAEQEPQISLDGAGNVVADTGLIVSQAQLELCDARIILTARQDVFQYANQGAGLLVGASVLCVCLFLLLLLVMQNMIVHPTNVILQANQELSSGNEDYRVRERANSTEFAELYSSFNEMADSLRKMRIEAHERQVRQQNDELKMLRAQLRPHFYLNAITTISNMTYQNRNEDIRKYLTALAKYMRYMLNTQSRWVCVTEEIEQIRSYLEMQKIKFPGSVDAYIGCAESVAHVQVPYLLLFTAVENSFKHAMNLYEPLWLVVQCERYQTDGFCGCRMIVEDNGKGFPDEVLALFSRTDDDALPSPKDHLGLTNIRRTLQLLYHRNDLLHLSNAKTGGAHVEIWIPEEKDETSDL